MNIEITLQKHPKKNLLNGPAPRHFSQRSSNFDVNVYIKRDGLTPLTLAGGKSRKLEFEIAQAKANGADILVTCGRSASAAGYS